MFGRQSISMTDLGPDLRLLHAGKRSRPLKIATCAFLALEDRLERSEGNIVSESSWLATQPRKKTGPYFSIGAGSGIILMRALDGFLMTNQLQPYFDLRGIKASFGTTAPSQIVAYGPT